jgi:hypothetical protein
MRDLNDGATTCGIRVNWTPEFIAKQARIASRPEHAQKELLYLNGKLHMMESELKSLRKADRRRLSLERELEEERARTRRSDHERKMAEDNVVGLMKLRVVTEKTLADMEAQRDREKARADRLERQLNKLRAESKCKGQHIALAKLTRSPAVAKRIAAACHPDKCPSELSDVATQLFHWVQSIREQGASVA